MGRSSSSTVDHFDERRHLQQPQSEAIKPRDNKDLPDYGFPMSVLIFVFVLVATVIGTLICITLYYYCFIIESPNDLKNRFKLKQMPSGYQSSQMNSSALSSLYVN